MIVVVEPAVDHVDPHAPVDRAHPDDVVVDLEIGRLDQLDPHRVGEEAVLVEGRVEVAGGEQHAHRLLPAPVRRDRAQRLEQQVGIVVDRLDREHLEYLGAQPDHRLAILEHVGDARRRARIVLEHEEVGRAGAHHVDAADMRIDVVRRPDAGDLRAELRVGRAPARPG